MEIDSGRADLRRAIATDVRRAHIIGQEKDHIGRPPRGLRLRPGRQKCRVGPQHRRPGKRGRGEKFASIACHVEASPGQGSGGNPQVGDRLCVQLLEQGDDQIDHAIEIGPVHHPIMGVGVAHRNNQIDGRHATGRLLNLRRVIPIARNQVELQRHGLFLGGVSRHQRQACAPAARLCRIEKVPAPPPAWPGC